MSEPYTRIDVCVHEAAHAVACALGGIGVHRLEVAPQDDGGARWTYVSRKGDAIGNSIGICETQESVLPFVVWDDDCYGYVLEREAFKDYLRLLRDMGGRHALARMRRNTRAHVCWRLAGPIANTIFDGSPSMVVDADGGEGEDTAVAEALCWLLPYRDEYDHLARVTLAALQRPDTWAQVLALGQALDRAGALDSNALKPYLPAPLTDWPPSPRATTRMSGCEIGQQGELTRPL